MGEHHMGEEKIEQNAERVWIYLRNVGCGKEDTIRVLKKLLSKLDNTSKNQ